MLTLELGHSLVVGLKKRVYAWKWNGIERDCMDRIASVLGSGGDKEFHVMICMCWGWASYSGVLAMCRDCPTTM